MITLGIESSCDETGVALYDTDKGIIAEALYSQISIHAEYGGVVPELASRDHIRKLSPLIQQVLIQGHCQHADIDGIAYTKGPGLVGALLTGAALARSLAWAWDVPALGIHHMEGHLLVPMLEDPAPQFPFIALLVSGGHTQLIQVGAVGDYQILGESVDDAAGEAFDKTAKLLGLGYPGGPALAALAKQGNPERFTFPRPMTKRPGLDFSFSGLKTYALTTWQQHQTDPDLDQLKADIARAFEIAVVETLLFKCKRALKQTGLKRLVIAGGVSANQALRQGLARLSQQLNIQVYSPRPERCTDNGVMIAYAGSLRLQTGEHGDLNFQVRPRWPLDQIADA